MFGAINALSTFYKLPNSHLNGHGCNTCGQKELHTITVLGKLNGLSVVSCGLKYDYSLVPDDLMVTGDKVRGVCR